MLARVKSVGVYGIEAFHVEVEVNASHGLPHVAVVGLPDASVKESIDRVRTAIINSGYHFRAEALTINLAPADLRKEGPSFDLPIAVAVLAASQQLKSDKLDAYALAGELALDGRLRPVRGCLSMALHCLHNGVKGLIVPDENAEEAAVVRGLDVIPMSTLSQVFGFLAGHVITQPFQVDFDKLFADEARYDVDFDEVCGQEHAKRALEIAAAGGHHVLMIGPPGAGKTMLSRRLPTILPDLSPEESLETTKIYSIVGMLGPRKSLMATRPFRSPHHTISDVGLVGGGAHPRPGELSLAHNGVLFLDELPEFHRNALEVLRQPLEEGAVTISRAASSVTYPCKIMLICAMNPCPCGYSTDPTKDCRCTARQIHNYLSRISGPLLDRIDLHVEVPPVPHRDLAAAVKSESSESVRKRVIAARAIQTDRFKRHKVHTNGQMTSRHVKQFCALKPDAEAIIANAMETLPFSARAYNKILKVSRTIADLVGAGEILPDHVAEAIQYRSLDRNLWA